MELDWRGGGALTHARDDLALQPELILETSGEIADAAFAVAADVGCRSDAVEHVAACE